MFGLRRIRKLEAEIAVLSAALDFYAINDNWRRRAKHSKGRHWELSAAGKDHGARAREALLKAKAIRRGLLGKIAHNVGAWWQERRDTRDAEHVIEHAAKHLKSSSLPPMRVTVPMPLPINESNGAPNVLP